MDNCKYRHILFLSYKDICYNSTSYFEQRISEELINAGIKVTHLNIPKPAKGLSGTLADTAYMLLKPYFNADLDAIIDINTTIPCIKYNNGYILNNFDKRHCWIRSGFRLSRPENGGVKETEYTFF